MKISAGKWVIDLVYRRLGNVSVAIIGAAIFFLIGSLISLALESLYELAIWNFVNTTEEIIAGLVALILSIVFTNQFTSIASYFSSRNFLPHLFNSEKNRRSLIVGLPLLLIASVIQLLIYGFSPQKLGLSAGLALTLLLSITLFALSVEVMNNRYRKRQYSQRLIALLLYVVVLGTSITFAVVFLYICVEFWSLWIIVNLLVLSAVACVFLSVNYYYDYINEELGIDLDNAYLARPSKTVAFVLLSKFNKPTIRALSFAKAVHNNLEILTICPKGNGLDIYKQYQQANLQIPLRLFKPQSSDFVSGAIEFLKSVQLSSPRELIVVYLPHYTSRHIFERILHNQASVELVKQIEKLPNIVVATVPWQR
jgi:MFS family permease